MKGNLACSAALRGDFRAAHDAGSNQPAPGSTKLAVQRSNRAGVLFYGAAFGLIAAGWRFDTRRHLAKDALFLPTTLWLSEWPAIRSRWKSRGMDDHGLLSVPTRASGCGKAWKGDPGRQLALPCLEPRHVSHAMGGAA